MKTIALSVLLMILAAGCQNASLAVEEEKPAGGREETRTAGSDAKPVRPPLDLTAPVNTETATFALG